MQDQPVRGAAHVAHAHGLALAVSGGNRSGIGWLAAALWEQHGVFELHEPEVGLRRSALLLFLLSAASGFRLGLLLACHHSRGQRAQQAVTLARDQVGRVALRRRPRLEAVVVEGVRAIVRASVLAFQGMHTLLQLGELGGQLLDRHGSRVLRAWMIKKGGAPRAAGRGEYSLY